METGDLGVDRSLCITQPCDCAHGVVGCWLSCLQVLFRRTQAHLLLNSYAAAEQDCQAAVAAAQQCGAPGTAAAVQECQELLLKIKAQRPNNISTGQPQLEQSAATDSVQQLMPSGRPQQRQQPAHGPSLEQLDMLLTYQQRQAQQYLLQQQQHCHVHVRDSVSSLLQGKLCVTDSQQQHTEQQHQRQPQVQLESGHAQSIRCCYSAAKGRYLVAATDIPTGTVLLAEWPLAAVAVKPQKQQAKCTGNSVTSTGGRQLRSGSNSSNHPRCGWCFMVLGMSIWPCHACPLVSFRPNLPVVMRA